MTFFDVRRLEPFRVKRLPTIVALGVWLLAMISSGRAAEVVDLRDDTNQLSLTPYLAAYRDPTGIKTLADVRQEAERSQFAPITGRWPSFGFTRDVIWLRFALQSESRSDSTWFLQLRTPRMDDVDIYLVPSSGPVEPLEAGNLRRPSAPMVDNKWPVFPLRVEAGEKVEAFLRVHSETALHLPLELWEAKAFASAQARQEAAYAAFFGYLAALIMLGFVFSMFARDRGYAIYSASLIGFFFFHFIFTGYYAWLDLPGRAFVAKQGMILVSAVCLYLIVLYVRYLLDLAHTMPRADRWARRMLWSIPATTVLFLAVPFASMYPFLLAQGVLIGIFSLAVALSAWRQGSRAGGYYVMAWMLFWTLFVVGQLQWFGGRILAQQPELFAMLGTALSATLFLIAMADRVREIRQNMRQAQAQLLAMERQATRELRQQLQQEQLLIRDLHDGIGGLTANVAILAELGRREAQAETERERFARISELASEGGAEVRSLISSIEAREMLWPDFFDECRRHGNMVLSPHGIAFTFAEDGYATQPGPGLFPGLSLFRVFKEALTNAVKHSGCTEVTALAEFGPRQFRLTVRDDGRGIPSAAGGGRGLQNMASRIREMGGTMTSRSETGTELVFELPLPLQLATGLPEAEA